MINCYPIIFEIYFISCVVQNRVKVEVVIGNRLRKPQVNKEQKNKNLVKSELITNADKKLR